MQNLQNNNYRAMLFKYSFSFLCAAGLTFLSCNSNESKKTDNSNTQTNNNTVETPAYDNAWYEKTLVHDSLNIELRTTLAANYYTSKESDKAIYHFLKIYKIDNKNLTALTKLGNLYYDTQQNEKAIEFYEKAIAIDNKNIDMRCDLATSYLGINKLEKAIQILKENIKMHYNHEKSHHNLSVILRQSGRIKEADEEMKIYNQMTAAPKNPGL